MNIKLTFEPDAPTDLPRGTTIAVYHGGELVSEIDGNQPEPSLTVPNVTKPITVKRDFKVIPDPGRGASGLIQERNTNDGN